MKFKKLFSKRFSTIEVISMLSAVILGVAVVAYAAVNIPYTFQPYTAAKASEVNANFQALAEAMPAVKQTAVVGGTQAITFSAPFNSNSQCPYEITNITFTPPQSGKVMLLASGVIGIAGHTEGYEENVILQLLAPNELTTSSLPFTKLTISASHPTQYSNQQYGNWDNMDTPFTLIRIVDVSQSTTYTYKLCGGLTSDNNPLPTGRVTASITALFIPSTLN